MAYKAGFFFRRFEKKLKLKKLKLNDFFRKLKEISPKNSITGKVLIWFYGYGKCNWKISSFGTKTSTNHHKTFIHAHRFRAKMYAKKKTQAFRGKNQALWEKLKEKLKKLKEKLKKLKEKLKNSLSGKALLWYTSRKCPEIPGKCTKSNSDFSRWTPSSRGFRKCMVLYGLNV